jgi:hypothetical protein
MWHDLFRTDAGRGYTRSRKKTRASRSLQKMPGVVAESADAAKWLIEVGMIVLLLNPVPFDNAGEHA